MTTPLNTATIILTGDELIPLADFAKAIGQFHSLLKALSSETGNNATVEWVIESLEISSTIATVKGIGEEDKIERIVRAYAEVGTALQEHRPIPYSESVAKAARGITSILNHRVREIRFETAEREVTVRSVEPSAQLGFQGELIAKHVTMGASPTAFGAVEGRIQTLTNRGTLRFTLYDLLHDKAVSCYLKEGYEDRVLNAWGKLAVVVGSITRDPISGRPLSVRQITDIKIRIERSGSYKDARGAAPSINGLSAEAAVRKVRDGE